MASALAARQAADGCDLLLDILENGCTHIAAIGGSLEHALLDLRVGDTTDVELGEEADRGGLDELFVHKSESNLRV